jgi:hypothetical protein
MPKLSVNPSCVLRKTFFTWVYYFRHHDEIFFMLNCVKTYLKNKNNKINKTIDFMGYILLSNKLYE